MPAPEPGAGVVPHWIEHGSGDCAVLCLHGISASAEAWRELLAPLSAGQRRALAWDMPGYGGSAALPTFSFAALAQAITRLLDAAAVERAVIVGHSLGGMVALEVAARLPQRVRGLVLACTTPAFGAPAGPAQQAFLDQRLGGLERGGSMAALAAELIPAMLGRGASAALRGQHQALAAAIAPHSYRAAMHALVGFDRRAALRDIACPCLCVAGTEDKVSTPLVVRRMAERLMHGSFIELHGAGHLAPFEQPLAFAAAVDQFLARMD